MRCHGKNHAFDTAFFFARYEGPCFPYICYITDPDTNIFEVYAISLLHNLNVWDESRIYTHHYIPNSRLESSKLLTLQLMAYFSPYSPFHQRRYLHGKCSDEPRSLVPPAQTFTTKIFLATSTGLNHLHALDIPLIRKKFYAESYFVV